MSTLKVATLTDLSADKSVDVTCLVHGSVKAYADVTASGMARAALNVSSITDGGTGDTTVSLTNAMADRNQPAISQIHDSSYNRSCNTDDTSATAYRVSTFAASSGALSDTDTDFSFSTLGDLA